MFPSFPVVKTNLVSMARTGRGEKAKDLEMSLRVHMMNTKCKLILIPVALEACAANVAHQTVLCLHRDGASWWPTYFDPNGADWPHYFFPDQRHAVYHMHDFFSKLRLPGLDLPAIPSETEDITRTCPWPISNTLTIGDEWSLEGAQGENGMLNRNPRVQSLSDYSEESNGICASISLLFISNILCFGEDKVFDSKWWHALYLRIVPEELHLRISSEKKLSKARGERASDLADTLLVMYLRGFAFKLMSSDVSDSDAIFSRARTIAKARDQRVKLKDVVDLSRRGMHDSTRREIKFENS